MLTNTKHMSETKTFIKSCIEEGIFCDVTLSFSDGLRTCNSFIFLLTGQFWKDIMGSLGENSFFLGYYFLIWKQALLTK